jgi:two-component system sensor histidine kinase ArlS
MKIRTKLALRFALIAGSIILLFAIGIYYFASSYRLKEFQKRLKNRAITTAKLLEKVSGVDSSMLVKIDSNTVNLLFDEENFIYNYKDKLLYRFNEGKATFSISDEILNSIKKNGEIKYSEGLRDVVGFYYPENKPEYVIICSAIDYFGIQEINNLRLILIISLITGIILIIISALFYSREAVKPISDVIGQVQSISANNLSSRLTEEGNKDEISMLAHTFNDMLNRLEKSFELQRGFVSNASHELRTPLTSINGQIDVALMDVLNKDEYTSVLNSIKADIRELTTLTNSFLEMAESGMENSHLIAAQTRIDDLLFIVKREVHEKNKNYIINISFDDTINDDTKLIIPANLSMLKRLFHNLIDNACKFSNDKTVNIIISSSVLNRLLIYFKDTGIGIPESEIDKITEPFYRASNVSGKKGYGIGLSMAKQIVALHKGEINISSKLNKGTTIKLSFPYIIT